MRYYNEAKSEQNIRRTARVFTFTVMFLIVSVAFFSTSDTAKEIWEEDLKEWFQEEKEVPVEKPVKLKKKTKRA